MGASERLGQLEAALRAAGEQWAIVGEDSQMVVFGTTVLGPPPEEVHGEDLTQNVHPDDIDRAAKLLETLRSHQTVEATSMPVRLGSAEDGWRWYELWLVDRRSDPAIGGIVARTRPLDQLEIEQALQDRTVDHHAAARTRRDISDDALASLAEVVPAAILTTDLSGQVVYTNNELRRLLRGPVQELTGDGWRNIVFPDDVRSVATASRSALKGERAEVLFRILDRDDLRWLHGRLAPMRSGLDIVGLVAVFDDVTAQREHEAKLAHRATHDALTGLPNRLLLRDRLSQALGRQSRTGASIGVAFIDLDGFKEVNDHHGHVPGDELLIEVARRLLQGVRPTDTVARLGGDEFVVVSDTHTPDELRSQVERLRQAISEPVVTSTATIVPSASIGVAITDSPATVDEMIHQADAAMYRAKRAGRGGIDVHVMP